MATVTGLLSESPDDTYSDLMERGLNLKKWAREPADGGSLQPPLPPWATNAAPGSIMKIEVMAWRRENGYHLHHPDDCKVHVDPALMARQLTRDLDNNPVHPDDVPEAPRSLLQRLMEEDGEDLEG